MKRRAAILLFLLFCSLLTANNKKIPHFSAMGNSGVAYGAHPAAAFINPALTALDFNDAALFISYDQRFDEVSEVFWSTYFPVYKNIKMGLTYEAYSVSGIPVVDFGDLMGNYGPDESAIDHTSYQDLTLGLVLSCKFNDFLIFQNPAVGLNIKQYSGNFSHLSGSNKTGQDYDLGFYTDLNRNLAVAFSLKDIGSSQLSWDTGEEENIDAVYTVGAAITYWEGMKILLDVDLFENADFPALVHTGMDIKANEYLSYRFGLDSIHYSEDGLEQKSKMVLNIGVGMSLLDESLLIDYAYLQSDGFIQDGSHLMSLSWKFEDPWQDFDQLLGAPATTDKKVSEIPSYDFKILKPENHYFTYDQQIKLKIINSDYDQVTINGKVYELQQGENQLNIDLSLSENILNIEAGERRQKKKYYRLPESAINRYAVDQLVLAANWQTQNFKQSIPITEFSRYLLNSLDRDISSDLLNVFSPTDILITSGIYPEDIYQYKYVTRGLFADVLIRLTGNDHIYNDPGLEPQQAAYNFLTESGLIYPEILKPLNAVLSEKQIIYWLAAIYRRSDTQPEYCFNYNLIVNDRLYLTILNKDLVQKITCDSQKLQQIKVVNRIELAKCDRIIVTDLYGNEYLIYQSKGQKVLTPAQKTEPQKRIEAKIAGVKVSADKQPPAVRRSGSVIDISFNPQLVDPGAVLEIDWQSEIELDRIYIKTLNGNFNMKKIDSNHFVLDHRLPADLNSSHYDLEFIAETRSGDFIKQYRRVAVKAGNKELAAASAAKSILADKVAVYLKVKPENAVYGQDIVVYAGLSGALQDSDYLVKAVFANKKQLTLKKIGKNVYKAQIKIDNSFKAGKNSFKLFVKDQASGQFFYQTGSFVVGKTGKTGSASYDAAVNFVKLKGDSYKIVVSPNTSKINKVTVIAGKQKVNLWQEGKLFVANIKASKSDQLKLYLKDDQGKYVMKKITVK